MRQWNAQSLSLCTISSCLLPQWSWWQQPTSISSCHRRRSSSFGLSRQADARVGGKFDVEVRHGNLARGVYTEIMAFRRVAFTWGWDSEDPTLAIVPPGASLVEIDLEPMGRGTLLRLRHSRLPKSTLRIHSDQWSVHLDRLMAEVQASVRVEQVNKGD
jgi:hypothetical protein